MQLRLHEQSAERDALMGGPGDADKIRNQLIKDNKWDEVQVE